MGALLRRRHPRSPGQVQLPRRPEGRGALLGLSSSPALPVGVQGRGFYNLLRARAVEIRSGGIFALDSTIVMLRRHSWSGSLTWHDAARVGRGHRQWGHRLSKPQRATFQQYDSTWTEDLLFIQPITQCVDTNLTLDFAPQTSAPENSGNRL